MRRVGLALLATALLGAGNTHILVSSSDARVKDAVEVLQGRYPLLFRDASAPSDLVTVSVVPKLLSVQSHPMGGIGSSVWGRTTFYHYGDNHHQVLLNANIFAEENAIQVLRVILAHELAHVVMFAEGQRPLKDDVCGIMRHELGAYRAQLEVEFGEMGGFSQNTLEVIEMLKHRIEHECSPPSELANH